MDVRHTNDWQTTRRALTPFIAQPTLLDEATDRVMHALFDEHLALEDAAKRADHEAHVDRMYR